MAKPSPLNVYLALRVRLLARDPKLAERMFAQDIADEYGVSKSVVLGVLNALVTDGYLHKHKKSFSSASWTLDMLMEGTDRLEVFIDLSIDRDLTGSCALRPRAVSMLDAALAVGIDDERFYIAMMELVGFVLRSGDDHGFSTAAFRLVPQAYYRWVWNLLVSPKVEGEGEGAIGNLKRAIRTIDLLSGDGVSAEFLEGLWSSLKNALKAVAEANPMLECPIEDLAIRNAIREHDVRARMLTLSHPSYPLYLPLDLENQLDEYAS